MNRRNIREHIFKIIFSYEFDSYDNYEAYIDSYLEELETKNQDDLTYIKQKAMDIVDKLEIIDGKMTDSSKSWVASRIGKVELAIIRVAIYEIMYDENVPNKVAINEAIEIGKKYGGNESPSFVNGVLAGIISSNG